ncbi:hypothetical protein EB796_002146 [Bugula neritina]|uniref:G-protein coupled receptors family 1 profile domain-containing protein n=1 Tax=Bugula neritina TaxID=10212 RepID=A0A7J7KN06_BUGNE|nr:hypothetical protein EB796_002146 [Bugula neritina]
MGNQSVAYKDILPCHNDTDQCYHPFVQILDGVNCLSIILNILHLVILNQMKEIKTIKYFFILVNFGISDIIFSISSILYYNCEVREAILQLHAPAAYWISKLTFAGIGGGAVLRFLAFLFSSIEKYIGVCQPYNISSILYYNCEVREAILQLHAPAAYWISKLTFAGIGGGAVLRFLAFLFSSIEKYIGCVNHTSIAHTFLLTISSAQQYLLTSLAC